MPPMKVLHCITSMTGGGAERQLAYLVRGLVSSGVETHVALTRRGENYERLAGSGATVHEISLSNIYSPALLVALHRLIRDIGDRDLQRVGEDAPGGPLLRRSAVDRNRVRRLGG